MVRIPYIIRCKRPKRAYFFRKSSFLLFFSKKMSEKFVMKEIWTIFASVKNKKQQEKLI